MAPVRHAPAGTPEGGQFTSDGGGGGILSDAQINELKKIEDDRPGVLAYAGQEASGDINAALRTGENAGDPAIAAAIDNLTNEIASERTSGSQTVYRGVGPGVADKWKAGDALIDKAFVSTTTKESIAHFHLSHGSNQDLSESGGEATLLKIIVPSGKSALKVKGSGEHEVIIQRGSTMIVHKVERSKGMRLITMLVGRQEKFS